MKIRFKKLWSFTAVAILIGSTGPSLAFDYEGHRLINTLALSTLPQNLPDFIQSPEAKKRIAFLAGEPDRWRNTPDLTLKHANNPDHYIDMEYVTELHIARQDLSPFRYVFLKQLVEASAKYPEVLQVETGRDPDNTKWMIGFLPWTIAEHYAKLKSSFSYYKVMKELGTPEDQTNAQANIIYTMGVMGHFVGDAAQPLHTTKHFNGWTGANPNGYTTNKTFHAWIDGGFLAAHPVDAKALEGRLHPAETIFKTGQLSVKADAFDEALDFILTQHTLVEPLYQLEKEGKLAKKGEQNEGRKFLEDRIVTAAQFLGDLWMTAWQEAQPDAYLRGKLLEGKTRSKR